LAEAMVNYLALLGWAYDDRHELFTREELIEKFDVAKISRSPAIFDRQKLDWMNGVYIRKCDIGRLTDLAVERLQAAGVLPAGDPGVPRDKLEAVVALLQTRVQSLADFPGMAAYFFPGEIPYGEKAVAEYLHRDYAAHLLEQAIAALEALPEEQWTEEGLEPVLQGLRERFDLKLKDVIQPIRVALTGATFSPGIYDVLVLMGKDLTLKRLRDGLRLSQGAPAPPAG